MNDLHKQEFLLIKETIESFKEATETAMLNKFLDIYKSVIDALPEHFRQELKNIVESKLKK